MLSLAFAIGTAVRCGSADLSRLSENTIAAMSFAAAALASSVVIPGLTNWIYRLAEL